MSSSIGRTYSRGRARFYNDSDAPSVIWPEANYTGRGAGWFYTHLSMARVPANSWCDRAAPLGSRQSIEGSPYSPTDTLWFHIDVAPGATLVLDAVATNTRGGSSRARPEPSLALVSRCGTGETMYRVPALPQPGREYYAPLRFEGSTRWRNESSATRTLWVGATAGADLSFEVSSRFEAP